MVSPLQQYEIHGTKRYLPYEENEVWRAFYDAKNKEYLPANYAVLKDAKDIEESLATLKAYYHSKGLPVRLIQKPDSIPLCDYEHILVRQGYALHMRKYWQLMLCLQPSPNLLVHRCVCQSVTKVDVPFKTLLKECGDGAKGALLILARQMAAGAKVFVAYNRAEIPVSFCMGENYGGAFCITNIFTAESQRKQGYGAAVLLKMLEYAKNADRGYEDIFINTENEEIRRLFEKAGFRGTQQELWSAEELD